MGLGSCALLAIWLNFTTSGLHVRAVSQDPSVARMMGIDADRLSLLVTSLSAAFAGVAGVLAGPYLSVDPGMDVTMIVNCLIIVVIGGTGSIAGAIVAALLYGFVQVAGSVFLPDLAALAPYALLMAVLLIAPARDRARTGAQLNGEAAASDRSGAAPMQLRWREAGGGRSPAPPRSLSSRSAPLRPSISPANSSCGWPTEASCSASLALSVAFLMSQAGLVSLGAASVYGGVGYLFAIAHERMELLAARRRASPRSSS